MGTINVSSGEDKRVEVALEIAKGLNNLTDALKGFEAPQSRVHMDNCVIKGGGSGAVIDVSGGKFTKVEQDSVDIEDEDDDEDDEDDEDYGYEPTFDDPQIINAISNMYNVSPYELVHGVQNAGTDDEFIVEDACAPSETMKAFSFETLIRRAEIHSRRYQTVGQFRKGGKKK